MKVITSDKHNRYFKMVFDAINNSKISEYKNILKNHKDSPELQYVLRLYNAEMSSEERESFARRVRKTEIDRVIPTLQNFGII